MHLHVNPAISGCDFPLWRDSLIVGRGQYRVSDSINLPFRVSPVVKELGRTRLEVNVKVKANYSTVTGQLWRRTESV